MDDEDASAARAWEIARAILRYLETSPEAKDTLEGIAQWWLGRELPEQRLEDVERAVSLLVSRGLILETRRRGVLPYYGLNPEKRAETMSLFQRPGDRLQLLDGAVTVRRLDRGLARTQCQTRRIY